jgi:hypothetical protein
MLGVTCQSSAERPWQENFELQASMGYTGDPVSEKVNTQMRLNKSVPTVEEEKTDSFP